MSKAIRDMEQTRLRAWNDDNTRADTFTIFEIQKWLPGFFLGMNKFKNITAWRVWAEETCYFGKQQ